LCGRIDGIVRSAVTAQEKPREVNAALVKWLATSVPGIWPRPA
jgi:hypothetical protein